MTAVFGSLLLFTAGLVNAQATREYNEWQRAQRVAQREHQQYLRTHSRKDYREWQRAHRVAQREHNQYLRELRVDRRNDRQAQRRYHRIFRNGQYYRVDDQQVNRLRLAINRGYQRGYLEGQSDRRYGRRMNYNDSTVYRNATYGYAGIVDRGNYQYYFQQGFQRGYEDGYDSTLRYGYRSGNNLNIFGSFLNTILNLVDDDN